MIYIWFSNVLEMQKKKKNYKIIKLAKDKLYRLKIERTINILNYNEYIQIYHNDIC